ncbi:hypothetical protein N8I77_007833 [Diaporthe amygdali]|uniref:Uncharacterized protein n=1 Tax=Phomopsis amygdali TaxID=1214568 RepID=A0AAD9W1S7_PHOAM|nr:hypothetical protein N8I77_007833 [Diaporthe amygdali]
MMSPRSLLFPRQNQNLRGPVSSSTIVSSGSPQMFSSPDSPPSTPSPKRKHAREFNFPLGTRSSAASVTTTKMAVTSRQPVKSSHTTPTPSPPRSTTTTSTRPTTPTSPVQIPTKSKRDAVHPPKQRNHRYHDQRRHRSSSPRWGDIHSPDAIPPSVAALLAVTAIPPPRSQRAQRQRLAKEKRLTVDSILEQSQESEKELSLNFIKGPLDVLLSPPEDLEDDELSIGESTIASPLSTRTVSYESVQSMPSLADSFSTDTVSSVGTPHSPSRGRRMQPTRRSLTPVSSPPGKREEHPLSHDEEADELDFSVFDSSPETEEKKGGMRSALRPFRSVFKSNLTSSLRALRNAARSFSSMNMPSIPPEDFLTRSILTMEPNVPFTDERMPPTLDEEPSAAVRRYLNPTQTARLESQASTSSQNARSTFTASIQMQTYKVHRSRSAPAGSRAQNAAPRSSNGEQPARGKEAGFSFSPGPRQREMRENSDFIRIAVMEMAMRRSGKLDEQRPGRARWALPPRKTSTKLYETGADGVPARWVSVTY